MRSLWFVAATLLLAACQSAPASCAPCAGPGFTATGLPTSLRQGTLRTCVGDEPCTSRRLTGPILEKSEQLVELADKGPGWERYDGTPIRVVVTSGDHRWQGSGTFSYTDGGEGTCSCSSLLAAVAMESVSLDDSRRR